MAKAKTKSKPKTLTQVSRQTTKAKQASRQRIQSNPVQGNIQKTARVEAQKRQKAASGATKRVRGTGK